MMDFRLFFELRWYKYEIILYVAEIILAIESEIE